MTGSGYFEEFFSSGWAGVEEFLTVTKGDYAIVFAVNDKEWGVDGFDAFVIWKTVTRE